MAPGAKDLKEDELYIALISIHGLIRGTDLELGRDADTGGQTKYVVDLAKALGKNSRVSRVELITRRIQDPHIDEIYSTFSESLNQGSRIVRIDGGPSETYFAKEKLWDYLDSFADNLLDYFRQQDRMPDVLHSHYADAGYVATKLHLQTGIPLVHTGHSLGRDKRKRLLASGMSRQQVEEKYNISQRIYAEESVLANADMIITSTHQEISDQYDLYDFYKPNAMKVIPPGTSLDDFHPPQLGEPVSEIRKSISRFLDDADKPMILALSRPDPRKNIASLLKAYGESPTLQEKANLVIIAGNRDDVRQMDEGAQSVLSELMVLIDVYDLYGKVALPKHHLSEEVPMIYKMAANSMGVFVNPALTEPFGLTLLEAAACGLPFVATENGGPVDIVQNCQCGLLVDPLNVSQIGEAIESLLLDPEKWRQYSQNGIKNVAEQYSWQHHAKLYLKEVKRLISTPANVIAQDEIRLASRHVPRMLVSGLDRTLLSPQSDGLEDFSKLMKSKRKECAFGIATARPLDSVLAVMKKRGLPKPDILICSLGTEIYFSRELNPSTDWRQYIDHNWNSKAIRRILSKIKGLKRLPQDQQSQFKLAYEMVSDEVTYEDIVAALRKEEQTVNVFLSNERFIDVLPVRASKGLALRYVARLWEIPLQNILVAGGSGTDEDMLGGNMLNVIVNNRKHEQLSDYIEQKAIYFAENNYANGILEAIEHFDFFGAGDSDA